MNRIERYMKTNVLLLVGILWGGLFFFAGCETGNGSEPEPEPLLGEQLKFTTIVTRDASELDGYDNPYSDRNLKTVPDMVGMFVDKKISPLAVSTPVLKNAIYRISQHKNEEVGMFWYKTSHPAAYWDRVSSFNFYAYAPVIEGENTYYSISDEGEVSFFMNPSIGIPVDFIYAVEEGKKDDKATSLHMGFRHKLCKMVFVLKNGTDNVVVCNGVKYSVRYPEATFNLKTGFWSFLNTMNEVNISIQNQKEIFGREDYKMPELTTLLFPVDQIDNVIDRPQEDVIVDFQVNLNNVAYSVKTELANLGLKFEEGKLIVITFDCRLPQGTDPGEGLIWNIYSATFDSFDGEGDGIYNGILQ